MNGCMTGATFAIAVALLCSSAAAEQPTVTFVSPCECQGFHGKNRSITGWIINFPWRFSAMSFSVF